MYSPRSGGREEQVVRRPERRRIVDVALMALTVVFWVGAAVFVALIASYSLTGSVGRASSLATGISLSVVAVSSGVISWVEFRRNAPEEAERGEWTNRALFYPLFYGLVCVISFFVAFLYLPALYFAP
jgi:hypothetical protein